MQEISREYYLVHSGHKPTAELQPIYAKHAEAAGLRGIRVASPEEIGPAWDAALAYDGPVLIEFMAGHDFPRPSVDRFVEQGGA